MPPEMSPSPDDAPWRDRCLERRRVLRWLGLAAAGASGGAAVLPAGCGGSPAPPAAAGGAPVRPGTIPPAPPVRVPLAALAGGARHQIKYGDIPVEVRRDGGRIAARVLLCTHMGCLVRWEDTLAHYRCVCHDGRFNAEGAPVQGFPIVPLARLSVRQAGGEVIVGESTAAGRDA